MTDGSSFLYMFRSRNFLKGSWRILKEEQPWEPFNIMNSFISIEEAFLTFLNESKNSTPWPVINILVVIPSAWTLSKSSSKGSSRRINLKELECALHVFFICSEPFFTQTSPNVFYHKQTSGIKMFLKGSIDTSVLFIRSAWNLSKSKGSFRGTNPEKFFTLWRPKIDSSRISDWRTILAF